MKPTQIQNVELNLRLTGMEVGQTLFIFWSASAPTA